MAATVFSYSGTSPATVVNFTRDPDVGDYGKSRRYLNPEAQAGGGKRFVHDKGVAKEILSLKWASLPAADLASLLAFLDVVDGVSKEFDLTAPDGATYTARIWNSQEIVSSTVDYLREEITLELLVEVP